ncbi:hypothetical protein MAR_007594 [Mya arenaria]|uniref:Reverse transcriptase domain-containing protein n=1 Tax=Mya arenaria TaxID=6604 RepID=A0ABY7DDX1_MYAAR|nr:hypothetical protein MAR_007594 [Mya arenaria]
MVILNLNFFNESIEYIHVKMESLHAAIRLITTGCFMASIDLKDAYCTVNVSEEFRKYLRFIWRGQLYQYTCLANGLACAPRTFTKLFKPVFSCLRIKGFPSVVYLNDSYLQGTTYAECLENVSVTQELLADIGFVINNEKSVFIPTQELNSANYTIRQVAEIKGKMISYRIAIPYGILYTKVFEQDKTKQRGACVQGHTSYPINNRCLFKGMGAVCEDNSTGGQWTIAEASFRDNINYLELNAVLLGLKAYTLCLREKHVRVRVDNSTAVAYINHMGGGYPLKTMQ